MVMVKVALLALGVIVTPLEAQSGPASSPSLRLEVGLVITRSVPGSPQALPPRRAASLDSSVITIGAMTSRWTSPAPPWRAWTPAPIDQAQGAAIRIDGGSNIRILNAKIQGYRIAVYARGTRDASLLDASTTGSPGSTA